MKRLLAMMLAGAVSVSAGAVDWVDLGMSRDGEIQFFIDLESLSPSDIRVYDQASSFSTYNSKPRYYSFFVKFEYIDPHPQDTKYILSHWQVDCKDKASFVDQTNEYDSSFNLLSSDKSENRGIVSKKLFSYAFPNTVAGEILKEACNQVSY